MPEHPLYGFHVGPCGDGEACGGMAKVVRREPVKSCGAGSGIEHVASPIPQPQDASSWGQKTKASSGWFSTCATSLSHKSAGIPTDLTA